MASMTDVLDFVADLQIVSNGDGFDVTLTDSQVEKLKKSLRSSINSPSTGKTNPVRVTNMRRVLLPVALDLSWPYIAMIAGTGILAGIMLAKSVK